MMIPTDDDVLQLWNEYNLPPYKRNHSMLVALVAEWFAQQMLKTSDEHINVSLLRASALLHDIDKNIPKGNNEHHPDTGVRVLLEKGYTEVSHMVKTHPLHAILDPTISPKTIEEKLLYLADKMVKHTIITVDERFRLWRNEQLPFDAVQILDRAYPMVKQLEHDILNRLGVAAEDVSKLAKRENLSTMNLQ